MSTIAFDAAPAWPDISGREWLETNGIGGWAASTIAGANTRRYHGLLVAATSPPLGRIVLLSKLDATLVSGGQRIELASNRYRDAIAPRGFELLRRFERGVFPSLTFGGDGWTLTETIAAIRGENTTVIRYDLTADGERTLELRPFLAARDYHSIAHANGSIDRNARGGADSAVLRTYDGIPPLHLFVPGGAFAAQPDWYYSFAYEREEERGFDETEDLFTPGLFSVPIAPGRPLFVTATIDRTTVPDGEELMEVERARREGVVASSRLNDPLLQQLVRAADQFIVRRGADGRTIVAGYHWFGDWGRDTMIALPGLCLATRRFAEARRILAQFASVVSEGMLPNRFPDSGGAPEYNTVDATLWFFTAADQYVAAASDHAFAAQLLPVFDDIVQWHDRGTRHGIRTDGDGLLRAGEPGVQLTWMDARVGDRVITPRIGKPVEIQALWYNALRILAAWHRAYGTAARAADLDTRADAVKARFAQVFWNEPRGCLFDVVADDGSADDAIRPNQLFAVSLPHPLVETERARRIVDVVTRELLTPRGLRSLAPGDPHYAGAYRGSSGERDAVYHQGTVWSWLLGPYLDALIRVGPNDGMAAARALYERSAADLLSCDCIGSVAEIFDGDAPHAPRGCVAQAWSIGELLRIGVLLAPAVVP